MNDMCKLFQLFKKKKITKGELGKKLKEYAHKTYSFPKSEDEFVEIFDGHLPYWKKS